jgi:hypothetical protein
VLLFENFKMALNPGSSSSPPNRGDVGAFGVTGVGGPPGANGQPRSWQLMLPMQRLLERVRDSVYTELSGLDADFTPKSVAWGLTVPAIWDEEGKAFMRKAAEAAGIISSDPNDANRLALVLEPEAAAIAALATLEPAEAERITPGKKIMIIDCGGACSVRGGRAGGQSHRLMRAPAFSTVCSSLLCSTLDATFPDSWRLVCRRHDRHHVVAGAAVRGHGHPAGRAAGARRRAVGRRRRGRAVLQVRADVRIGHAADAA